MKIKINGYPDGMNFYTERLESAQLDKAVEMCDRYVGKNLYPREYLQQAMKKPDHFFFFLKDLKGNTAGYFYFYLSNLEETAGYLKMSADRLLQISSKQKPLFVNLRSIGICDEYRGRGLATSFVQWSLDYIQTYTTADMAVAVCWKPNGRMQVKNTMTELSFQYFGDLPRFWYDISELKCPYCQGRCVCSAAFYYKQLRSE